MKGNGKDTAIGRREVRPGQRALTTGAVARLCGVATRTVSKWCDSGKLRNYRIPGSEDRRVPVDDLLRFMKEHGMPTHHLEEHTTYRVLLFGVGGVVEAALATALPSDAGYRVESVQSSFDVGCLLYSFKPNCVLIDLSVGRSAAGQVLGYLRASDRAGTLVLALAGEDETDEAGLVGMGFDGVFVAPHNPQELAERVRQGRED
jgi:two-component system response regulator RpaA